MGKLNLKVWNYLPCLCMFTLMVDVYSEGTCSQLTSCSCKYDDGSMIDLSPIANQNQTPRFMGVKDTQDLHFFSYNPCYDFTEQFCELVAVCQIKPSNPMPGFITLGSQDSATFITDEYGHLAIQYTSTGEGLLRSAVVTLTCDQSTDGVLIPTGEREQTGQSFLELKTKYACFTGGGDTSLSVGTIICISLVAVLALYMLFGVLFNKIVRKETGMKAIPNSKLWTNVPGLIKDGIVYTISCGKRKPYAIV